MRRKFPFIWELSLFFILKISVLLIYIKNDFLTVIIKLYRYLIELLLESLVKINVKVYMGVVSCIYELINEKEKDDNNEW